MGGEAVRECGHENLPVKSLTAMSCCRCGKRGEGYAPWSWEHILHFRQHVSKPELWWAAVLALYSGQRQSDDTALTRIPRGSSSAANTRAKDRSAALAAPYAARVGIPLTLAIEVVRTTAPPRFISGASFCTAKNGPLAFRLNISSYMVSVVFSSGAKRPNPALTKSRSKVSNSAFTRAARASMSVNERASLETSRAPFPNSFCAESRPGCE